MQERMTHGESGGESHPLQTLEEIARGIAQRYPELRMTDEWAQVPPGFSGANNWRVTSPAGSFALRAWPMHESIPARIAEIHRHMDMLRELTFVPRLLRDGKGATLHTVNGRIWEVSSWMPGVADFRRRPTLARLLAAVDALASIHRIWRRDATQSGPSPGIHRRHARLLTFPRLETECRAWSRRAAPGGCITLCMRSLDTLLGAVPRGLRMLAPWLKNRLPLQPCLPDLWHDHILYRHETVTGIIDFGSVRQDFIGVDLARLLGSLVPDDQLWRNQALQAYSEQMNLPPVTWQLVTILDVTGDIAGVMNWCRWLLLGEKSIQEQGPALARWALLLNRLDSWLTLGSPGC